MIPQLQTKLRASILAAFLFPSILAPAQTPATDLNTNFVGKWTGQLEYRDFQSNAQVFLPTWLTITESTDHKALQFNYVYDDGPPHYSHSAPQSLHSSQRDTSPGRRV